MCALKFQLNVHATYHYVSQYPGRLCSSKDTIKGKREHDVRGPPLPEWRERPTVIDRRPTPRELPGFTLAGWKQSITHYPSTVDAGVGEG